MKAKAMNRFIAIMLIVINLFVLAGCENTVSTTQKDSESTTSTTEVSEASTLSSDAQSDTDTEAGPQMGTPPGTPPDGAPGEPGGNGSTTVDHGSYVSLVTEDSTGETYESTSDSENAVRVEGSTVTLTDATINKTAGETGSGDSSNFYGVNAGLLAMDGANVTLNNAVVNTTVEGANGIFSYSEGTTVTVNNATIQTTADSAGGIMVTGGGTMVVKDSVIDTEGDHSAALRTDRGGGTLTVDGGTYTSNGTGSPAVYSTADISVSNATLTANNSEALVIEGKNSINLTDCIVSGNMTSTNSESVHNVMIYQSMSGDADTGTSTFTMTNGDLTANQGDMIYVTNTSCTIELTNVTLDLYTDVLLNIVGNNSNNWGTEGSNGGQCVFTVINQILTDKIIVDEISSLDLRLTNGSSFTGTINSEDEGGTVSVNMDSTSEWALTGDTYVTELTGSTENIDTNGYTLYVNGVASN